MLPRVLLRRAAACGALAVAAFAVARADAATAALRHQADLQGDVAVFGSTLGWDCGAGKTPPAGTTVVCTGQQFVDDGAPDLYWRDTFADSSITALKARTSATLVLPSGAKVTYARLYWAALKDGPDPDKNAILDWLGGPLTTITADKTWVVQFPFPSHPNWYYYQSTGDATAFVQKWGAGDFRVTDVDAIPLANVDVDRAFSAWTLVVFYEKTGDELRNLALFDGFLPIDPGVPGQDKVTAALSGFLVPPGWSAKMSAFMYEGDFAYTGDHFTIGGVNVSNALNPADNFFNSSRTHLGAAVSGQWDVPKLSGQPNTMAGYDLDTVDLTPHLKAGQTSATVGADSSLDIFFLGGFVTSITNKAPDFKITKTATDLNGGALLKDDELEYTIAGKNEGNDASANTVLTDLVEQPGLAYVPGSLEIVEGANSGKKTDAAGDDQGEFDGAAKKVTVRLGAGATATAGGTVPIGGTFKVRFHAKVQIATGFVANQAVLVAAGQSGAPEKSYLSDGDPTTIGSQPTTTPVDECSSDAQCKDPKKPVCDLSTHTCGPCKTDGDCKDALHPACQPDGSCGQCSATNTKQCKPETPVCDPSTGKCVACTPGPGGDATKCKTSPDGPVCLLGGDGTAKCGCLKDSDCGGQKSGKVCDDGQQKCVEGCRGQGGNDCPDELQCTSKDTSIGKCVAKPEPPPDDAGAGGGPADAGAGGASGWPDAGPVVEAGPPPAGDATAQEEGGCGCAVPGGAAGRGAAAALIAAAAAVAARRRRETRRRAPGGRVGAAGS